MPMMTVAQEGDTIVELHFEDQGSGRPVVLIHGWPLSNRSWDAQVPALLAAGYRVVTYDRRGFGHSTKTEEGYDYDTLAADLSKLLETLNLVETTLVGFSMGGGEVARYLGTHDSSRVAQAVFAAAVPPYLYKSEDNPDGGLDDETIGQFEGGVDNDLDGFLEGFVTAFFSAGDSELVSQQQHADSVEIAKSASLRGTHDCIAAFGRTDFRADLEKVDVPTLVIHGDSDGIVPFEVSGRRTHETIGGSSLAVIEGGPHGVNVTHAEEFNEALLGFLSDWVPQSETPQSETLQSTTTGSTTPPSETP